MAVKTERERERESFYPRTVRDLNTVPDATVQLVTVDAFRRALLLS